PKARKPPTGRLPIRGRLAVASARVVLDHEVRLHHDRVRHFVDPRNAEQLGAHLALIHLDIVGHIALAERARLQHQGELPRRLLDLDDVADLDAVAWNGHAPAVHFDVAVADELARREYRRYELGTVDNRITAPLEQPDHMGAGIALLAASLLVDAAELTFRDVAVVAAQF